MAEFPRPVNGAQCTVLTFPARATSPTFPAGVIARKQTLARGVWLAPYLIGGVPVLIAVTSRGECVRQVPLTGETDENVAIDVLEHILDEKDPLGPRRTDA